MNPTDDTRCLGHCCEEFVLSGDSLESILGFLREGRGLDGPYIADMVVPIRPLVAGAKLPNGTEVTHEEAGDGCIGWVFTCRHFDSVSRQCQAYAERPAMCRDYPYRKPCKYSGCTWQAGKNGTYPPKHFQWEVIGSTEQKHVRRLRLRVLDPISKQVMCDCAKVEQGASECGLKSET